MRQPEQEPKNQNKCPKCGDTCGVNAKLEPVCKCSIDEDRRVHK